MTVGITVGPGAARGVSRLRRRFWLLTPALLPVGLMLVWGAHDGGYDADTWYWGALLLLASLVVQLAGNWFRRPSAAAVAALALFSAYVAWSYLSIAWANSPGDAWDGSNRALLYLLLFAHLLILPWTARAALVALWAFVLGIGAIALVILVRLASGNHVPDLIIGHRLAAPTGYFNATAALFTMQALVAVPLAARRDFPAPARGLLISLACASLQLAVVVQSRGWLFTLPLVLLLTVAVLRERLRVILFAAAPVVAALAPVHRLLHVYQSGSALDHAARNAGHTALELCLVMFIVCTVAGWAEPMVFKRSPSPVARRSAGTVLAVLVLAAVVAGGLSATHGHPLRFVSRQWRGFSNIHFTESSSSHFADVGSGRYDFWRVSLDALAAHPVLGLGQDNFADYYVQHRRTGEEPSWTHSLEMRLLAHTGLVGTLLFVGFLAAAVAAALRGRRSDAVAAIAVVPLIVWLVHGSVDWFWEMPALSGPAIGFLALAASKGRAPPRRTWLRPGLSLPRHRRVAGAAAAVTVIALSLALGLPYLSVRQVSTAADLASGHLDEALADLQTAARLNPLTAIPGRTAGAIALRAGLPEVALQRFLQATQREPGGWFSWLGAGLAESVLGDAAQAKRYFRVAYRLNPRQPAVRQALTRVNTTHPLNPAQAFGLLVVVQ